MATALSLMTGLALDERFDFSVNDAGDIAVTRGISDVEKDLAVIAATVLDDRVLGGVIEETARLQIESLIRTALLEHGRVEAVPDVSIRRQQTGNVRGTISAIVDGTELTTTI